MEILECPLYEECKEEECPYFENEDCTYHIKHKEAGEWSLAFSAYITFAHKVRLLTRVRCIYPLIYSA